MSRVHVRNRPRIGSVHRDAWIDVNDVSCHRFRIRIRSLSRSGSIPRGHLFDLGVLLVPIAHAKPLVLDLDDAFTALRPQPLLVAGVGFWRTWMEVLFEENCKCGVLLLENFPYFR